MVSNAAGNGSASSTLYVHPYFVVYPETEVLTTVESVVNFRCVAEGFPQPNITWVKRNVSDTITGPGLVTVETGDVLLFSPVVFGDEGEYLCIASSRVTYADGSRDNFGTQTLAILTGD